MYHFSFFHLQSQTHNYHYTAQFTFTPQLSTQLQCLTSYVSLLSLILSFLAPQFASNIPCLAQLRSPSTDLPLPFRPDPAFGAIGVEFQTWLTIQGRKDLSTQASEALKPESQKGVFEKAGETITNAVDSVVGAGQPQQEKSTSQKVGDAGESCFSPSVFLLPDNCIERGELRQGMLVMDGISAWRCTDGIVTGHGDKST